MKKVVSVALIILAMNLVGCGDNPGVKWDNREYEKATFTERKIYANEERSCFCIVDKGDIEGMLEAAKKKDVEYIEKMLADGRAFVVREITKVRNAINLSDAVIKAHRINITVISLKESITSY